MNDLIQNNNYFIKGNLSFALHFKFFKLNSFIINFIKMDYYKELELDRSASQSQIAQQYRRLSLIHHP